MTGLLLLAGALVLLVLVGLVVNDFIDSRRCSVCLQDGAFWRGNPRDPKDRRCKAHRVRRVEVR